MNRLAIPGGAGAMAAGVIFPGSGIAQGLVLQTLHARTTPGLLRWNLPCAKLVTSAEIVAHLRSLRSPRDIEGMRRFGITTTGEQLGVSVATLRAFARPNRRNHALAIELWESGIHEARVLAALVDDPARVTRSQMERWARQCDNWALTDACCCCAARPTP